MSLEFSCPECNGTTIDEIQVDVVVRTDVLILFDSLDYGEQDNSDGVVDRYQCSTCGWNFPAEITDLDDLLVFLKENCKNTRGEN